MKDFPGTPCYGLCKSLLRLLKYIGAALMQALLSKNEKSEAALT